MLDRRSIERVHERLLEWYRFNARDLPWRRTRDAYAILVAEVMLQQTQVDRVLPRWYAWLERFPTLASLAAASRADAIRAWQGLGYNRRAVQLHGIARQAVADWGGTLPADIDSLLSFQGIGGYTARAIACFAYEQPAAMVDTNVRRVLSRVFQGEMITSPAAAQRLADDVLPIATHYAWNQALMDLGATLCRAQQPRCLACPLVDLCRACQQPSAPIARRTRPSQRFEDSDRFLRGRLVDAVRTLGPSQHVDACELAAELAPAEPARVERLLRALASDGLLARDGNSVRLPD